MQYLLKDRIQMIINGIYEINHVRVICVEFIAICIFH